MQKGRPRDRKWDRKSRALNGSRPGHEFLKVMCHRGSVVDLST
jgi:hypothetical protein